MKMTIIVKLQPSPEQREKLLATMRSFNAACEHIAGVAFENKTASKFYIQHLIYREVRERFGLSAQLTIRAIAKVCEAFKRDKTIRPTFKEYGAIVYDQRILSWKGLEQVSMLTTQGRERIPIIIGEYQRTRLDRIRGHADLIYRRREFYLCVVVEVEEPPKNTSTNVLGIDVGTVYLAADSDGERISGKAVEDIRKRHAVVKASLQRRGTHNAKRHLKRLSGRERRFRSNTNHIISKKIVAKAKGTGRMIAVEDLTGIRCQITVRKAQRSQLHSWSFGQLRQFIEYKATLCGIHVIAVNPRGTSHTCPRCGIVDRKNRPSRDRFLCISCGLAGQADTVAAINIAARAAVNPPIVPSVILNHVGSPLGTSPPSLDVGI